MFTDIKYRLWANVLNVNAFASCSFTLKQWKKDNFPIFIEATICQCQVKISVYNPSGHNLLIYLLNSTHAILPFEKKK